MATDSKLYTWIDVQDALETYFNQNGHQDWLKNINFRAYWDGLNINYSAPKSIVDIENELEKIFLSRYQKSSKRQFLILEGNIEFPIFYESVEPAEIETLAFKPAFGRVPFIASKEPQSIRRNAFDKPIFFAFHSFKGGVGRTLHALALAIHLAERNKVLLIDADFEAPGISWLVNTPIAFADFLALIHGNKEHSNVIKRTAENLRDNTKENGNLFVLPAFRSLKDKAPLLEVKPEHIFRFNNNPFILTDVLVQLANELAVDYVIIDLRAGVSELSSSWFFDPRINKVFVTTLSSQSILGTAMMFSRVLAKFEQQNNLRTEETPNPSLIISQVPQSSVKEMELNWSGDVYSTEAPLYPLRMAYTEAFIDLRDYSDKKDFENLTDEQIIGSILSPITLFSEEIDSLKSLPDNWDGVSKLIKQNELDRKMVRLSEAVPAFESQTVNIEDFAESRLKLKEVANGLIFAETTKQEDFLVTESIRNLSNNFHTQIPIAVVVGAKGSGKTFLFKQIADLKNWQSFGQKATNNNFKDIGIILPITIPSNLEAGGQDYITIPPEVQQITNPQKTQNIWQDYIKPDIELELQKNLTSSQWREKWLDYMAWAGGYEIKKPGAGRGFIDLLKIKQTKAVAIFDGLEDLFKHFNDSTQQQTAIEALLQDVPNWLESQPEKYLGVIVFVRKDIVTSAISQNLGQFLKKHESYELKWNAEEALRLVHWILNRFEIFKEPTFQDWKETLGEKKEIELVQALYKLWGMRMAKNTSKEAYSHNWILGSLANLKKEVQSRDIVRFLMSASEKTIAITDPKIIALYNDRLLFPTAIRDSIGEVGSKKIEEVKVENEPLKQVLEILEYKTKEIKFPCKPEDVKNILPEDKQIRILEDNGVMVLHNGEYYMAEIYRKGMGFEYSRIGRPKVLYF